MLVGQRASSCCHPLFCLGRFFPGRAATWKASPPCSSCVQQPPASCLRQSHSLKWVYSLVWGPSKIGRVTPPAPGPAARTHGSRRPARQRPLLPGQRRRLSRGRLPLPVEAPLGPRPRIRDGIGLNPVPPTPLLLLLLLRRPGCPTCARPRRPAAHHRPAPPLRSGWLLCFAGFRPLPLQPGCLLLVSIIQGACSIGGLCLLLLLLLPFRQGLSRRHVPLQGPEWRAGASNRPLSSLEWRRDAMLRQMLQRDQDQLLIPSCCLLLLLLFLGC